MSFNTTEVPSTGGSNIPALEGGIYPARIVGIANLGLHEQSFEGETKAPKEMIHISYEFLDEFLKDEDGNDLEDKPRFFSERFPFNNLKSDRAKSTIRYMALDQELKYGGDFSKLLGMPCMVTLATNKGKGKNQGRTFNKVMAATAMRAKEAANAPALINTPFLFDFYAPTQETWDALPEWMQNEAKKALDFPGSELDVMLGGEEAIPFEPNGGHQIEKNKANEKVDW